MRQKNQKPTVESVERRLSGRNPIGRNADKQKGYIARHDPSAEIAGIEKRGVAPGTFGTFSWRGLQYGGIYR